jgi:subtilisin family serine protease
MIEENRKLSAGRRIRVVSVSDAPSSPFRQHRDLWDKAVAQAEREGILVLDCTRHHGIVESCFFGDSDRTDPAKCRPGYPGMAAPPPDTKRLIAPASPRTTAEQYAKGDYGYQYTGMGGLSWAVPYVAGILALGWQERPDLTAAEMVDLLFTSALPVDGRKVIRPKEFILAVKAHSK